MVEEIAAKVNGEIVTKGDLDELREETENELTAEGSLAGPSRQQRHRTRR